MSVSTTASRVAISTERRARALDLRKRGLTLEEIATDIGVTRQAVHAMVKSELKRLNDEASESTEELRRLELERLDLLQSKLMDRALDVLDPDLQDKAVDRVAAIMARRAKLLGLDAPTTTNVQVSLVTSPEWIAFRDGWLAFVEGLPEPHRGMGMDLLLGQQGQAPLLVETTGVEVGDADV